jgi:integral membrane sensor domain MASE1
MPSIAVWTSDGPPLGPVVRDERATGVEAWPAQRVLIAAILVSAAYFLSARLGLLLRLPGTTPSVLWPPNAILTSALILVPPRLWGVMLFAAVPAHLTLQIGTQWPLPLVLLLFATNCS